MLVISSVALIELLSQKIVKNSFMGFLLQRFIAPMENYEGTKKCRFLERHFGLKNEK